MFHAAAQIEADLVRAGIGPHDARRLAEASRPAIWLESQAIADEREIGLGATKIGGWPDLPHGVSWPIRPAYPNANERARFYRRLIERPDALSWEMQQRRRDAQNRIAALERPWPLDFVAQIDFRQMWTSGPLDPDMPTRGLLSIFYDVQEQPWGFDPRERMAYAILYHEGSALVRRDPPEQIAEQSLRPRSCLPHPCVTPLPPDLFACAELGLQAETEPALRHWWYDDDTAPRHRVGGWPTSVQGDMQVQCALVGAGVAAGSATSYVAPELAAIRSRAAEWLLLAQFGSDEGDLMWGDLGWIYLWIRRSDLLARRFEGAHLILQCS